MASQRPFDRPGSQGGGFSRQSFGARGFGGGASGGHPPFGRPLPGGRGGPLSGLGPLPVLGIGVVGLLLLPSIEIAAFVAVASAIGFVPALLAFVLTSLLGLALLRSGGPGVLARVTGSLRRGEMPAGAVRDSLRFVLGGVLMVVPGFVTDAIGFALMLPGLLRSGPAVPLRAGAVPPRAVDPRGADPRFVDLAEGEWQVVSDRSKAPL